MLCKRTRHHDEVLHYVARQASPALTRRTTSRSTPRGRSTALSIRAAIFTFQNGRRRARPAHGHGYCTRSLSRRSRSSPCHPTSPQGAYRPSGALEPDACRLLKHISYARTTLKFQARGLDGVGRDQEEYKRAAGRAFRRTLMNCTAMLTLSGLYQRLPDPLPSLALLPS